MGPGALSALLAWLLGPSLLPYLCSATPEPPSFLFWVDLGGLLAIWSLHRGHGDAYLSGSMVFSLIQLLWVGHIDALVSALAPGWVLVD